MKRWLLAGMTLSFIILALALAGLGKEGAQRPLPFNPKTVETVEGLVVEAPVIQTGGIPEMERLTLETPKGKLTVVLGPNWFLAQQDWQIATLDRIEVMGSRLDLNGKPALIAQKVKKGEQVIEFRDQSGRPLWTPPRPPAR
jgi:hypothetical protein